MKPGKIAQDIEDELRRERRSKVRALKLKKLHDEYKKRKEGAKNGKEREGTTKDI